MERLLVIKLDAQGCEAEAWLNGIPLARVNAARPRAIVPIHEYTLAGANRIEMVVWPKPAAAPDKPPLPPQALVSDGKLTAQLRILLPRVGNVADESTARTLAQLDWAPPKGQAYEAPVSLSQEIPLPVSFPRWRWLDAPLVEPTPALQQAALALLQGFAEGLARGEVDGFLAATRFRTEELALAYQRPAEEALSRLRNHLAARSAAAQGLAFLPLEPDGLVLRRLAGGRLLECLDASGRAALRTAADAQGQTQIFPLRLAAVEGKLYVLR